MDQITEIQIPTEKIYKDRAIWVGTFLGGPLVAGYLIAENFKAFKETSKAKATWVYTIIATIIIFGGIFLIPEDAKIPNQLIPLIYTAIAYYIFQHFQGKNIAAHINAGGQFHSWWRVVAVGIIGLILTVIPIFGFAFMSDSVDNASILRKNYGILNHEIVFNDSNISETEVDKIAEGFIRTTYFDQEVTKYVYVKKVSQTYELSLAVVDGIAKDEAALQPFVALRTDLQTLFPENKIVFKLVVDSFDNVVKIIE